MRVPRVFRIFGFLEIAMPIRRDSSSDRALRRVLVGFREFPFFVGCGVMALPCNRLVCCSNAGYYQCIFMKPFIQSGSTTSTTNCTERDHDYSMSTIAYYLLLPFLYLISYLPFRVLYLLSDLLYLLIYKVFGYREQVVTENLKNAFPGKSHREIETIRSGYYRHFCDLCLETIKTLSVSPSLLQKHFKTGDISVLEHYFEDNQSVILVTGHLGSWEMGGAYLSQLPIHQLYVIYRPMANKHFDRLFFKMRTRSGTVKKPEKSDCDCIYRRPVSKGKKCPLDDFSEPGHRGIQGYRSDREETGLPGRLFVVHP